MTEDRPTEDRLREALAARADAVVAAPDAYDTIAVRRRGRAVRRWAVPATAAALTAAVVGVAVALPGQAPAHRPPVASGTASTPPAAEPRYLIGLDGGMASVYRVDRPGAPTSVGGWGDKMSAVAAVGDGRTFYVAMDTDGCASELAKIFFETENSTFFMKATGALVDGRVTELAVSRDGKRLAYVVRRGTAVDPNCANAALGSVPELWVRDTATGRATRWLGKPGEGNDAQHVIVRSPTFSPDGRYLAYDTADCCAPAYNRAVRVLDTADPGRSFLAPPALAPDTPGCHVYGPSYRGRYGTLGAVRECGDTFDAVTLDPVTGAVTGEVFAFPTPRRGAWGPGPGRLVFDASGDHALVEHENVEDGPDLGRWEGGAAVGLPGLVLRHVTW